MSRENSYRERAQRFHDVLGTLSHVHRQWALGREIVVIVSVFQKDRLLDCSGLDRWETDDPGSHPRCAAATQFIDQQMAWVKKRNASTDRMWIMLLRRYEGDDVTWTACAIGSHVALIGEAEACAYAEEMNALVPVVPVEDEVRTPPVERFVPFEEFLKVGPDDPSPMTTERGAMAQPTRTAH